MSPALIYTALGSNDRNLYDRNVTTLRISGILNEICSATQATAIAKKEGKAKQDIARFEVVTPDKVKTNISNKIYIYDLPLEINKATLKSELSIFGEVVGVELPRDKTSKIPHGYAFVEYSRRDDALKAVAIKNIKIKDSVAGILPYKYNGRPWSKKKNSPKKK